MSLTTVRNWAKENDVADLLHALECLLDEGDTRRDALRRGITCSCSYMLASENAVDKIVGSADHLRLHRGDKSEFFVCWTCSEAFPGVQRFNSHQRFKHGSPVEASVQAGAAT